jgi:signal transduction histidine kinase
VARLVVENGGAAPDQAQVAGLGLSIVAAIAEAHGGTLDLHARAGGGLRVSITLPLATHPASVPV